MIQCKSEMSPSSGYEERNYDDTLKEEGKNGKQGRQHQEEP